MAITFSKSISETNFLNAYNNNIVKFTSDAIPGGETIVKASITIIGSLPLEITPINDVFRYNFNEAIEVLINQNNFSDDILPTLLLGDATSHIYDDTANTFINPLVTFTITFSDDTTDTINKTYKWLKSVEQLEQNKTGVVTGGNGMYILSPFRQVTANTYDVTYFEGYPFDIALLLDNPGVTTFLNQTNALSFDFTLSSTVNRVFFSDGRTTITIDDHLPLVDGLNRLKITRGADIIFVNVTKIPTIEGQYIKFINQYGEWNYWLFNCQHRRNRKDKDLGDVNNDFNDVSETTSPFFNLGKTSQDTLTLISDALNQNEQDVLDGLLDSPKVYYFTGTRLSQVTDVSWLTVKKKSATSLITDYKDNLKNYKVQIELPQRFTMTL